FVHPGHVGKPVESQVVIDEAIALGERLLHQLGAAGARSRLWGGTRHGYCWLSRCASPPMRSIGSTRAEPIPTTCSTGMVPGRSPAAWPRASRELVRSSPSIHGWTSGAGMRAKLWASQASEPLAVSTGFANRLIVYDSSTFLPSTVTAGSPGRHWTVSPPVAM